MKKPRLLWAVSLLLALACAQENKTAPPQPPDAGNPPKNPGGLGDNVPQNNPAPDAATQEKNPGGLGDAVPQKNQAQPNQAKTLDPRTPSDFARAWGEIKRTADPDEQADKAMALGKAWKGLRLRWTGAALAELCLDAKRTCATNPFEKNTTPDHHLLGGLFPLVGFTEEAWGKLKQGCQGQSVCVVTFEAELSDITTDPDVPLNLQFTGAQVTEARAPKPEENWFARPELKLPAEAKRPPNVGKPSPPLDLSKLKPKTF
jgi:hypothetical protein